MAQKPHGSHSARPHYLLQYGYNVPASVFGDLVPSWSFGGCAAFRRWGLVRGSRSLRGMGEGRIWALEPFPASRPGFSASCWLWREQTAAICSHCHGNTWRCTFPAIWTLSPQTVIQNSPSSRKCTLPDTWSQQGSQKLISHCNLAPEGFLFCFIAFHFFIPAVRTRALMNG